MEWQYDGYVEQIVWKRHRMNYCKSFWLNSKYSEEMSAFDDEYECGQQFSKL